MFLISSFSVEPDELSVFWFYHAGGKVGPVPGCYVENHIFLAFSSHEKNDVVCIVDDRERQAQSIAGGRAMRNMDG